MTIHAPRPQLTKCMIEFMNPKVKFTEMTRLQRISCIKVRMDVLVTD